MIRIASDMPTETREKMRGGSGKVTVQHLFNKDEITAKTRLCARLILPPSSGIGMHRHDSEDELFYILRGTGLLDDGHTQTRVIAGDAILTGKGESHAIANPGPDTLEILAVIMTY